MDEALRISEQLRATGTVTRGRIGVQIGMVTKDVAESIGMGKAQGAFVSAVEAGSPADKAGVQGGDIITKLDGRVIEKHTDLPRLVGNIKPGTKSTLTVLRPGGGSKDLSVTIAELEADKPRKVAEAKDEKPKASTVGQSLGLAVSEVTDALKKELKLKGGVKVDAANEAAARAGLREGDVIVAIANTEVANVKEFEAAVAKVDKNKPINVLFRRAEWTQYALIRPQPR
jgi:serine protease Do